jgi:hypothetical protein
MIDRVWRVAARRPSAIARVKLQFARRQARDAATNESGEAHRYPEFPSCVCHGEGSSCDKNHAMRTRIVVAMALVDFMAATAGADRGETSETPRPAISGAAAPSQKHWLEVQRCDSCHHCYLNRRSPLSRCANAAFQSMNDRPRGRGPAFTHADLDKAVQYCGS